MTAKSRKDLFSSLKSWVQRFQITIINASVTVFLIGIVIFVMLNQASLLQRQTTEESIVNLAGMTANEVQAIYVTYYDIVRTTSQIMRNYNNIEIEQRRTFIKNIMLEILNSNNSLINIYSLWKPNALDGMDSAYANTKGTDATGQFITGFTRENSWVEEKAFTDYRYVLNLNYQEMGRESGVIGEPFPMAGRYRNSWVVDVQVPILVDSEVVGIIGATINLEVLQFLIETKRPFGSGHTMVVTTKGNLVAHNDPNLRGASFMAKGANLEEQELLFSVDIAISVFNEIQNSMNNVQPTVFRALDSLVVSYPLRSTDPVTASYHSNESGFPRWAVVTTVPMTVIMAPINRLLRFSILFIIGAAILMVFVVFFTSSSLTQRARLLQRDLERATIMQDNLKYGLFLMDQNYIIQGEYSKAVEKILAVSKLQGKSFIELLSNSLKPKEKQGVTDYFEMVFKGSFDKEMLDSVNPINIFVYRSTETGDEKSLRTNFTMAERGGKAVFILGTLEDITAEKELEKQLLESQNLREKEMQFLFQVIQLNPRVLGDFIEDTEYEFDKINEMLKNKTHFHREVLVEMYQSIHAIKSNALILNLETFGNRLHGLETSIKNLQEKYEDFVPFDDFLGLVLEIDEALKEKDQLKVAISRIQNFKSQSKEEKDQERYVLVETLTQVCKKTQDALDKKVRFVVESIDDIVMNYGPRRVIKDVLTQLVRNAVYHGIEMPEERTALGKDPEGEVKLSVHHKDNQVVIKLTDNGKGINFDKIRQTAEEFKMFNNPEEANDTNFLLHLLFSPGFSTLETADLHAGRGMGLNLVMDRIKEIHGNLKVSTMPGKGTTFTVTIPMEIPVAASH